MSVLLDGKESELVFIDHPSSEMSVSNNRKKSLCANNNLAVITGKNWALFPERF